MLFGRLEVNFIPLSRKVSARMIVSKNEAQKMGLLTCYPAFVLLLPAILQKLVSLVFALIQPYAKP